MHLFNRNIHLYVSSLLLYIITISTTTPIVIAHHGTNELDYNDINNELTVKLMQTLTDDDNALFSPVMLTNVLLLAANTVNGGTAKEEVLKVFTLDDQADLDHVNLNAKETWKHRSHLYSHKAKHVIMDKTEVDLLPKLLLQSDKPLNAEVEKMLSETYPMDVFKISSAPTVASTGATSNLRAETKTINDWFVQKSTTGIIGKMLDDNELTSDVKMLALNGAAFKGAWRDELFGRNQSSVEVFHNADGKTSQVDFLSITTSKQIPVVKNEDEKWIAIQLPFTDHVDTDGHQHQTNLVLLMSTSDEQTIDRLIDSLNRTKLDSIFHQLSAAPLTTVEKLKLPKLNFEKEYELKESLSELNVKSIFDKSVANFSQIIQNTDASNPGLYLNQLDHKAIVQWNEDGTPSKSAASPAAAAATPLSINVDKPFLFFITDQPVSITTTTADANVHQHDALVVFAGRVKTLTKEYTTFGSPLL